MLALKILAIIVLWPMCGLVLLSIVGFLDSKIDSDFGVDKQGFLAAIFAGPLAIPLAIAFFVIFGLASYCDENDKGELLFRVGKCYYEFGNSLFKKKAEVK